MKPRLGVRTGIRQQLLIIAAASTIAIALTACGSGSSTASTGSTTSTSVLATSSSLSGSAHAGAPSSGVSSSSPAPASGGSGSGSTGIDDELGQKFGGGTIGKKAAGTPMVVGWVAQEGGTPSDPEASVALQAAFDYINNNLDGAQGHPLTISKCVIVSSDAQGQVCGQQFLNDPSVNVILQVGLNYGNATLHATINGKKPVLMSEPNPGPDTAATNAYGLTSASISYISSAAAYLKSINARKIAMISADGPIDVQIANGVKSALEAAGLQTTLALFPETGTDLVSPLVASGATTADAVLPLVVTPASCVAMGKAAKQINLRKPIVATGLCATDALKKALGDYPQFTYEYSLLSQNAADTTGQVAFYRNVTAKYAPAGAELGLDAPYVFGAAFALAKTLNGLAPAALTSSASIGKGLAAFTGPLLLGPPTLKVGSVKGFPALMSGAGRYYTYGGNGSWTASGSWIVPD